MRKSWANGKKLKKRGVKMGSGLEYLERLSKRHERLKAQRKRIIEQQSAKAEEKTRLRRRGWSVVAPQKEILGTSILGQQKISRTSAKWDKRTAKWDRRARKHRW